MSTFLQDLRYGVRSLLAQPLVAAAAIGSLALGIGLNVSIFSVVNAVLLQPLPVPHAEQLIHMYNAYPGAGLGDGRGNNMLAHLDQQQQRDGRIGASRRWRPACSFMADTASALLALIEKRQAGVVHLDSNATRGHTFEAIVRALAQRFERGGWVVQANDDYAHDQRLVGHETLMPPLAARLALPT